MASATPPGKITLPTTPTPREIFNNASYESPVSLSSRSRDAGAGGNVDLNDDPINGSGSVPLPKPRRRSARPSFAASFRRNGPASFGGGNNNNNSNSNRRTSAWSGVETIVDESMKLPSLVPGIRPAYSTPLPVLPMLVLCIVSPLQLTMGSNRADRNPGNVVRVVVCESVYAVPAQNGRRCVWSLHGTVPPG